MKRPIALRIEAGLLAAVRRCAAEENRSLTNFIETVLKARVAGRPRPPAFGADAATVAPATVLPSRQAASEGRRQR